MISMGSRARLGLAAAGLMTMAVLAGCSQQEPGVATAPPTGEKSSTDDQRPSSGQRPTTTTTSANGGKIAPCSLLADADAAKFGLATPGKAKSTGGIPDCRWAASGQFGVLISVLDKGLAQLKDGEATTVGSRKAVQFIDVGQWKGCTIAMEVSDSMSVVVVVSPVDNTAGAQMCPRVREVAEIVDSKLP